MNHKFLLRFAFAVLMSLSFVSAWTTNTFNNSLTTEDLIVRGGSNTIPVIPTTDTNEIRARGELINITKEGVTILQVQKDPLHNATEVYIKNSSGSILATSTFIGDIATFNYPVEQWKTYMIVSNRTSGYTRMRYVGSASYPDVSINFNWISGIYNDVTLDGTTYNNYLNIITTSNSDIRYLSIPNSAILTKGYLNISGILFNSSNLIPTEPTTDTNEIRARGELINITKEGVTILQVQKDPLHNATEVYIKNSSGSILATSTFIGDIATFNYPVEQWKTYMIVSNRTSGYTRMRYVGSASYPDVSINFNWISGIYNDVTLDGTTYNNYLNITTNTTVQSNFSISINNNQIWNLTGTSNQTNNLASKINNYLNITYLVGSNYLIPFVFRTEITGILRYLDLLFSNDGFLENSQTFSSSTYETSSENIIINLTYDSSYYSGISANLIYNGTSYAGTKSGSGNNVLFSRNLIIPIVATSGTNKSFYWRFALLNTTGTYYYNSSSNNQTILKGSSLIANYTCPSGYSPAFNFTLYYEQNLTTINATSINYYLTYGLSGNSSANSINSTILNTNSFSICINNSQTYYDVGYGEIQYKVEGAVDRRYYIFSGTRLTNTTVNIPIYALESYPIAVSFLMTAETTSLVPYVNYYIGLMRWYPSLNSYKIVDMGKTDDKGQTVLRVKTEDIDYKFALYKSDGTLVKLSSSVRMICQTTPCVYTLYVDPTPLDLTTFTNIQKRLTWNSTTKIFTFIWNDPSQTSQIMNLTVYQDTGTTSTIICSSVSEGYTGTMICDVSAYTGTLRAEVTRTASPSTIISQLIIKIKQTFVDVGGGAIGLFIGAILLILFALIGIISPAIVVILSIISLIPLVLLGNITIGIFTAIGVIGGVILHFLSRTTK